MADYSLTGNANWSAIKASINNNDRIVADGLGAWILTLDEDPTQTGIDFVSAAGAYVAIGTPSTVTLSGWKIRATSNTGITVGSGKTIIGPFTAYGSTTTASKYGCNVSAGGSVETVTTIGGSASSAHGLLNSGDVTTATNTGGSVYGAHGMYNSGTVTTATNTGGSVNGAHGMYNSGSVTTATNTGGSVSGAYGMYNSGTVSTATNTGGSVSGAYGMNNAGGVKCTANIGNTSGAFGLDNYGLALSDVRNRVGDYAVRRSRGLLILYGGTSTTGITGTAGDLLYIPEPANTVDGVSVMGESGTYPTTVTTQIADAATLTNTTLNADGTDTTVYFGICNGTAKSAAVYTAAQAAQLATDQAGAPANLRTPATSIGGVAGTLDVAADNTSDGGGIGIGI